MFNFNLIQAFFGAFTYACFRTGGGSISLPSGGAPDYTPPTPVAPLVVTSIDVLENAPGDWTVNVQFNKSVAAMDPLSVSNPWQFNDAVGPLGVSFQSWTPYDNFLAFAFSGDITTPVDLKIIPGNFAVVDWEGQYPEPGTYHSP